MSLFVILRQSVSCFFSACTVLDLVYNSIDGVVATSSLFFNCLREDHPEDSVQQLMLPSSGVLTEVLRSSSAFQR